MIPLEDWCYGGTGVWNFPANPPYYFTMLCAGNNYGIFKNRDYVNKQPKTWTFGPGHVLAETHGMIPVQLRITGWSGGDTCRS